MSFSLGGQQVMKLFGKVVHQQGTAVIVVTYDNRLRPVLSAATPEDLT